MKTDIYDTDFKSHPKARGASATAVPATSCKMCVLVKKETDIRIKMKMGWCGWFRWLTDAVKIEDNIKLLWSGV